MMSSATIKIHACITSIYNTHTIHKKKAAIKIHHAENNGKP